MKHLIENALHFRQSTQHVLQEMLGLQVDDFSDVEETGSVESDKDFLISIYYTGTVYGEYLIALNETTAAAILGIEHDGSETNRNEMREQIADTFSELLNMIVGESLVRLQSSYAKLTLTPPRVIFGTVRYPKFRTARSRLSTNCGEIECHFCLDLMRLDLATSYNEGLPSLLDVNQKLRDANSLLAQQQAQLVHSEKMASIGMLASGVAHEINNPLFFMDTNLCALNDYVGVIESMIGLYENLCSSVLAGDRELLAEVARVKHQRDSDDLQFVMEDSQQLLSETRQGVHRIRSIVNGLKEFSQPNLTGVTETDLNSLIENAVKMMSHELREGCAVQVNLEPIPRVVCNAAEIGQVTLNVLLNAAQALENQGTIKVSSKSDEGGVAILVEDTGHGIHKEALDKIFDPFFTTKPVGQGVGLGLAISFGIVRKHNGSISVESKVGQGTRLTIRLPISCEAQTSSNPKGEGHSLSDP